MFLTVMFHFLKSIKTLKNKNKKAVLAYPPLAVCIGVFPSRRGKVPLCLFCFLGEPVWGGGSQL